MPNLYQIECAIAWSDLTNRVNAEQFIFRQLQLKDINAYTDKGKFKTDLGKLHFVDNVTTRERVYIWTADKNEYPNCNCLSCKTVEENDYTNDFQLQLTLQLHEAGADVTLGDLRRETQRVRNNIQIKVEEELREIRRQMEQERRDREFRERAERRDRERQLQQQATSERVEQRRINREQKKKEKEQEKVATIQVHEVNQVRMIRLED